MFKTIVRLSIRRPKAYKYTKGNPPQTSECLPGVASISGLDGGRTDALQIGFHNLEFNGRELGASHVKAIVN